MAGFDTARKVDPVELPNAHKVSGDRPLVDMADPGSNAAIAKMGRFHVAENGPGNPGTRPDATPDHIPFKDGSAVNRRPNGDRFDIDGTAFKFSGGEMYVTDPKNQDVYYARNRSAGLDRSYNNGASTHYDGSDTSSGSLLYKGHAISFKNDRITSVDGETIPPYKGK